MPSEYLFLLLMLVAFGAWLNAVRQKEHALTLARNLCSRQEVQLLDETVSLAGIKLRRHGRRLALERHYRFEVSIHGQDRQPGGLWLSGGRLAGFSAPWLNMPEGEVLDARETVARFLDRVSHEQARRH